MRSAIWGRAALVGLLAVSGKLTLISAFQVFALTSAIGAIVQTIQVRPRLTSVAEGDRVCAEELGLLALGPIWQSDQPVHRNRLLLEPRVLVGP